MTNLRIIDVASLVNRDSDDDSPAVLATAKQLVSALSEEGFLYIKGHDVPESLQSDLETVARAFFAEPLATKNSIRMENAGRVWKGYFPVGAELTSGIPDQKEGLYFGTEIPDDHPSVTAGNPMHGSNQWASDQMRDVVLEYTSAMRTLGEQLMRAVGLGLGLSADYFASRYDDDPTCLFRIFNYPSLAAKKDDDWSVRQHTDMGFLTILKQDDLGGLEVQSPDGEWLPAPPVPGTFVINIGDMLELWTWGKLRATLHRVRNTASVDRLSFPFFFDPGWDKTLERIDRHRLGNLPKRSYAEDRWDQLDLGQISADSTYGEFVWNKVKRVFPHLV